MKIKHLFLTVLAGALALFTSCEPEESPISSLGGIELGSTYITIARGQQTASTTMKISESWTSRVPEWLAMDPSSGAAGDYTLTFTAKADTLDKGKVEIIFGGKSQVIMVTRDGDKPKPAGVLFEEPFIGHGQGDFVIKDVVGSPWSYDAKYGMKATAFINNANTDADSYLISPEIDLAGESAAILTFEDAVNYMNGKPVEDYLSVEVTTDNGANWEKVTVPTWPAGSGWDFFDSGNVDLSKFVGKKIKFAFHYTSNTAASPTWEVKNVKLANVADTTPTIKCSKTELTVDATATSAKFSIVVSNLTADWTVSTSADWIKDYTKSGNTNGNIEVSFDANTLEEARTATFTVTSAGAEGITLTLTQRGCPPPALFLNEFQCGPEDSDKHIEIYNSTDAEVDMTGWTLNKDNKDDFVIPAAHAKVPAKGFIVYTCKSDGTTDPAFGLSGTKGFIITLTTAAGTVVDKVDNSSAREGGIVAIENGKSWGRETDGANKFVIFDTPTIGASNGATPKPATIAELLAAIPATATGNDTAVEVEVDFAEPVTVSYVNGKNAYLEDATGAILLFLQDHGLQPGITLKGQLKVKGYWYNGIPELVSYSGTPTLGQGAVPETAVTIAQLLADYDKYLLRKVKLTGVKVTDGIANGDRNGKIKQGDDEIAVYAQINNGGLVLTEGDEGDFITIPGLYKTTKQVYLWENGWWTSTATDLPPTITAADITGVAAEGVVDATVTITLANADGWTPSVTPDGTVVTAASLDGTTLKYTVAENTATEARDGKITITLKKEGKDDVAKEIKVSQKAAESPLDPNKTYYKKVTAAPEDWSGKYLLVVDKDDINKAFKGFSSGSTVFGEGADVTITSSAIESTETTDAYQIVIAKATVTEGAYTIKFGENFFTWTSGNSLNKAADESVNTNWNITYVTDHAVIRNAADATRNLQWNKQSPRFACYGSDGQTVIQLYKLEEAAAPADNGSGIPDYDPITGFEW